MDGRIKHHIINAVAKDFTEISTMKLKQNTNLLRGIFEPSKSQQLQSQVFPGDRSKQKQKQNQQKSHENTENENQNTTKDETSHSHNDNDNDNNDKGEEEEEEEEEVDNRVIRRSVSTGGGGHHHRVLFQGIHSTNSVDEVQELSAEELLSVVNHEQEED